MAGHKEGGTIHVEKLNMVMTYPLHWTKRQMMENFIQNFYDAVGYERFADECTCSYENGNLILEAQSEFSWDLLTGFGVSTKRDGDTFYAGRFGEGFKIAALAAYRDFHYSVTMQSGNWRLEVTEVEDRIEDVLVSFLAYRIEEYDEACPEYGITRLLLGNADVGLVELFKQEKIHFYYQQNPLLGKPIYEEKQFSVYHAPEDSPTGRLFISLQDRAKLPIPVVFCNHSYVVEEDDRDRTFLPAHHVENAICMIIWMLPGEARYELLLAMRSRWSGRMRKKRNGSRSMEESVYRIMKTLVANLSYRTDLRNRFQEEYGDRLVCGCDQDVSVNNKHQAENWFAASEYAAVRKRVDRCFASLGIETLNQLCERNGGYIVSDAPNTLEQRCLSVLFECAQSLFEGLYCYDVFPDCKIIPDDYKGTYEGMAESYRTMEKVRNAYGLTVQRDIREIKIARGLFRKGGFTNVFPVFIHELLHQYGGDCSRQFRKALFIMNEILLDSEEVIREYILRWDQCWEDV